MDKDDELELFRRELADVRPLKQSNRIAVKPAAKDTPGHSYRRRVAQQESTLSNGLSTDFAEPLDPEDILSFKRDGVQHGVFRKLKQGAYPIDATLDLHRLSVDKARDEVWSFIQHCVRFDIRTALVCHGKGRRSESFPVIKSFLAKWLPEIPEIIAFHSARNFHGGTGSVYILLKKNRRQKDANRRRFYGSR